MPTSRARIATRVPEPTLAWLTAPDNPAVAVLARRTLLGEPDSPELATIWAKRNEHAPMAAILDAQLEDGSWLTPSQDYKKYQGSLWQVHFLGELHAHGDDERVRRAAEYAFSRQLPDGSWSATNMRPAGSITCLTANVGRALARLGWERDERVLAALGYCVQLHRETGVVDCRPGLGSQLNGYCHMLLPKILLFLAEVPRDLWPDGTEGLRDESVVRLRDKNVFRCLPEEARRFDEQMWSMPAADREGLRERFLAESGPLHYKAKPGWLRFGYPLSYNSDVLEALAALAAVGEKPRPEYDDAIALVRGAADSEMRWTLRTTFNGKMLANVETKGQPSKWLTLRALQVLDWAES